MSSTNKTTYYELPQFTDNDIFNPLVDDNDAYSKIDTALHNIANAEADDASDIVSVKSRLDSAEGDIDALEAQNGSDALTTSAQTLSGAINEVNAEADALAGRVTIVEDDLNNASTGLKAKVDALGVRIDNEANTRANADMDLDSAIDREKVARENADTALGTRIDNEASARNGADTTLQTNINTVSSAVTSETSARTSADANLQSQIDELIAPSGESPSPAEVENARITTNNVTAESLGNAIRSQITQVENELGSAIKALINNPTMCEPFPFELVAGDFSSSGFVAHNSYARIKIPVAYKNRRYLHIEAPNDGTYIFHVYKYVSDTSGTLVVNDRYNSINLTDNFTAGDYYITFARSGAPTLTLADYEYILEHFNIYYLNQDEVEYKGNISSGSLDGYVEKGKYLIAGDIVGAPTGGIAYLIVDQLSSNKEWLVQRFETNNDNCDFSLRFGRNQSGVYTNNGAGLSVSWGNWCNMYNANSTKKVLLMGDSIFGQSISPRIDTILHQYGVKECINGAFGGTRATNRDSGSYSYYDLPSIVDAILSGDWTAQVEHASDTGIPATFATRVATLSSLDFSTLDILVLEYGTNDYTAGVYKGAVSSTPDVSTFLGSLDTQIRRLSLEYPNLTIVICTPLFRVFLNGSVVEDDSDTKYFNSDEETLKDFVEGMPALASKYHIDLIDMYNEGVNKYNYATFTSDGTHPNNAGNRRISKRIFDAIGRL